MPTYQSPGVYIEEIDRGAKPIEAVGTSVAAFVGFTDRAGPIEAPTSLLNTATLVTNWGQYARLFGDFTENAYLPHAVYGYFLNGGGRCYVTSVLTRGVVQATLPAASDAKTISLLITAHESSADGHKLSVLIEPDESGEASEKEEDSSSSDDPTKKAAAKKSSSAATGKTESTDFRLIVKRGRQTIEDYPNLTMGPGERNVATVVNELSMVLSVQVVPQAGDLSKLFPKADTYSLVKEDVKQIAGGKVETIAINAPTFNGDEARREGLGGLAALDDVTMVAVPDLMMSYQLGDIDLKGVQAVQTALLNHCELMRYRFAILDSPPNLEPGRETPDVLPQAIHDWRMKTAGYDSKYGALYYPWIEVSNPLNGKNMFVPPSGHMAGVYARTDGERGVHKAPANEIVRGALGLQINVTKGEQDGLNPDGINCIRAFPGRGIRVWGGRTLSSDGSWRYINVRRLFNMVEHSIERGTQWIVFEPNDQILWAKVRRDVTAFLRLIWRSGALFGATPEEAFYVKCDEELNPVEVRDAGQLIIEVGLCPVKPAEFVIFRISQWAGPNAEV